MKVMLLIVAALALATSNALPVNRPVTVANDGTVGDAIEARDFPEVIVDSAVAPVYPVINIPGIDTPIPALLPEPVVTEVESPSPVVLPEAVAPVVVAPETPKPVVLPEPIIPGAESPSPIVLPEAVAPVVVEPETPSPVVLPETISPVVESPSSVSASSAPGVQAPQPTIDVHDVEFTVAGSGDPTRIESTIENVIRIDNDLTENNIINFNLSNDSTFTGTFLGLPKSS